MGEIQITGINHVALNVRDLKKSSAWYKEVLEMEEDHGNDRHVFLRAGDQVLALFQSSEGEEIGSPHHVALSLPEDQREKAIEVLKERGVDVSDGRDFHDPDDHRFHFA